MYLQSGDGLLMQSGAQALFQHALPPVAAEEMQELEDQDAFGFDMGGGDGYDPSRLNITWRVIDPERIHLQHSEHIKATWADTTDPALLQ